MQAMLLAYEAPGDFERRTDKAQYKAYIEGWFAFGDAMRAAGVYRRGGALEGPETGTVVSVQRGRRTVEDGPFSDSKEQLGGFVVIEVASLADAAAWAQKCPAAKDGRVDVRVVPDYGQGA